MLGSANLCNVDSHRDTYTSTIAGGVACQAFVPLPLPPVSALDLNGKLQSRLDEALIALGRLDAISTLLPDARLVLYSYVRKEAVMSSPIEGTQSSLSDPMLHEIEGLPGVPLDDGQELSCYVKAMSLGLERIRQGKSCHQMLSQFLNLPQSAG